MELNATIVTINNLLKLNFKEDFKKFLPGPKEYISIPDYQREYKWDKGKIRIFVSNVMQRSKFLGIITTEVPKENYLGLVDGQQRLTTIILMLAQLYNACADEGETETQQEIESLITCHLNGARQIILKNESVGEYLNFRLEPDGKHKVYLNINQPQDIYKQTKSFDDAWNTIAKTFNEVRTRNPDITLDAYKQRLLDCTMLLFAQQNTSQEQQGSSEEIYIDINEKAKRLDPEDIFKGHCFAICKTDVQQKKVKELWRTIKKNFFALENILVKADMDTFLHYFLLTQEATLKPRQDIKQDLTIKDENIVAQRYNTPTKVITLLERMVSYQKNLLLFVPKLEQENYSFSDIMLQDAQIIGNKKQELKDLRHIVKSILCCNQNLFKLPLFYIIDQNCLKTDADKLKYSQLSKFFYLYYLYMFSFSCLGGSKKRENLANELIYQIGENKEFLIQFITEIKKYGESLEVSEKVMQGNDERKHLYAILDNFIIKPITCPVKRDADFDVKFKLFPTTHNLEHLIVNQSHKVEWKSSGYCEETTVPDTAYVFSKSDFADCHAWTEPNNRWQNFVWIDQDFNREHLGNKDIINKLLLIRGSYDPTTPAKRNSFADKHRHIEIICQQIMKTAGFSELKDAYENNAAREVVLDKYKNFINNYFSEESTNAICAEINRAYKTKLQELYKVLL